MVPGEGNSPDVINFTWKDKDRQRRYKRTEHEKDGKEAESSNRPVESEKLQREPFLSTETSLQFLQELYIYSKLVTSARVVKKKRNLSYSSSTLLMLIRRSHFL